MRTLFAASGLLLSAIVAISVPFTESFVVGGRLATSKPQTSSLSATPADAIATLAASQSASVDRIAAAMPGLTPNTELSWSAMDGVTVGGAPASLDGRECPGADGNVAWLSNLCVQGRLSGLTIFNGPLTNVPHLLSTCVIFGTDQIGFILDFRPRAYGAYEKRDEQGNYPGPDELGREAFTFSGNRKEYDTKFGTPEVQQFLQSTMASFEGASEVSYPLKDLEKLTRGPLYMDVVMPLTDGNVATIAAARDQAVSYWLQWATVEKDQHAHRPGAPINSQYVYDTKYRQNAFGALLPLYNSLFGRDDGAKLAAADSGPLDEAYVGGGS